MSHNNALPPTSFANASRGHLLPAGPSVGPPPGLWANGGGPPGGGGGAGPPPMNGASLSPGPPSGGGVNSSLLTIVRVRLPLPPPHPQADSNSRAGSARIPPLDAIGRQLDQEPRRDPFGELSSSRDDFSASLLTLVPLPSSSTSMARNLKSTSFAGSSSPPPLSSPPPHLPLPRLQTLPSPLPSPPSSSAFSPQKFSAWRGTQSRQSGSGTR